ncbi:MAG: hypothetical protein QM784_14500 [Polyangiaceae bacterium]
MPPLPYDVALREAVRPRRHGSSFFCFTRSSFRGKPGIVCSASLSLFLGFLFANAVLFETHQLLQ